MDDEVVDERVDRTVCGDADADWHEDRQTCQVEAEGKRTDHDSGKDDWIQIVELETTLVDSSSVYVVASVKA